MSKDPALPSSVNRSAREGGRGGARGGAMTTPLALGSIAALLYFSEGLPFGIVTEVAPVYLRVHHVALLWIGLFNALQLPWTFKFLWSPLIDRYGSYRRWISGAVAILSLLLLVMAVRAELPGRWFWIAIALLAVASATQDIAVDAYTIAMTPERMLGPVNSIRVTAYRAALMAGGGGLLAIAGWIGWRSAFAVAAAVAGVILLATLFLGDARGQAVNQEPLLAGLTRWFARPGAIWLITLVFLYRAGEFAIVSMVKPFWVDRGYSIAEIGTITTVVGVAVSIAGAIAGGLFVARFGIYRSLFWLGIAQTASNAGYALVATFPSGKWEIYTAAVVENFGFGLGTAAFLAFLMSICDREHAATEYALLTAAYSLARTIVASGSGAVAPH
jgi:PAT family beta-lactamase induction signal transducer AmpG